MTSVLKTPSSTPNTMENTNQYAPLGQEAASFLSLLSLFPHGFLDPHLDSKLNALVFQASTLSYSNSKCSSQRVLSALAHLIFYCFVQLCPLEQQANNRILPLAINLYQ